MKILFITFYFEPDLSAGSFRNTSLFKELRNRLGVDDFIHVVTTQPNRYATYSINEKSHEKGDNYQIDRIKLPAHKNGMADQAKSFITFYRETKKITKDNQYDLVYASSSRLFSAFLGRRIATSKRIPLYLDIRDIFADTIKDVFGNKKLLQKPVYFVAKTIEKYTFSKANHINLVSEGFKDYFKKYPQATYSFFTNGIDDCFLNCKDDGIKGIVNSHINSLNADPDNAPEARIIITYAGNIGSGQGLERIVPQAAKELGNRYLFRIIGDGGTKKLLEEKIRELNVENVEIIKPVNREELIKYYQSSTYLFLHLNDLEAFKKVLPSKIFEYGAFNKPIIAGVGGYAAQFIKENLTNYILFLPTDVDSFVKQLRNFRPVFERREEFVGKFSRGRITREMAESVMTI